jgi:twitching motility protein PilT
VSADECVRASGDPNEFLRMIGKSPLDDGSAAGATNGSRPGDKPMLVKR